MHPRLMFWSNYEYTDLYSTVAEFQKTMMILPPFPALVKDFEYRLPR